MCWYGDAVRTALLAMVVVAGCAASNAFTLRAYEARLDDLCMQAAAAIDALDQARVDEIVGEIADMEGPVVAMDVGTVAGERLAAGRACPELASFRALEDLYYSDRTAWEERLAELRASP